MFTVKEVLNKKITEYLSSENPFFNKYSIIASTLILLLWLGIVIFTSINHEIWRDEMRALSIALEPSSLFELPTAIKNEGHPILWYLLLRIGYSITGSVLTLKVISIIIALMAVILFLWKAPFPIWQKLIFIFGVFPIYEYSVMTRNYGISMLLFFLFAALYQKRKKYSFLIALLLALLANTNIHSTILACLLAGIWFWDDFIDSYSLLTRRDITNLSLSFVLILTGILLAVLISLPDKKTAINIPVYKDTNLVFQSLMSNIIHPARSFEGILLPSNIFPLVFNDLLLWLLLAGLLVRTKMLIALAAGIVLLGIFFDTAHGGSLRHIGLLLMFIISLYWIVRNQNPIGINKFSNLTHYIAVYGALTLILVLNLARGAIKVNDDINYQMSSAKSFGSFLIDNPQFHDAIIVGEPDYLLEALPYYFKSRICIPRESRFGNRVMFTTAAKTSLSLSELLAIATEIKQTEKVPVLIALGHFNLTTEPPFSKTYSYNKTFTWSPQQLDEFQAATDLIAKFTSALGDENFEIYQVR